MVLSQQLTLERALTAVLASIWSHRALSDLYPHRNVGRGGASCCIENRHHPTHLLRLDEQFGPAVEHVGDVSVVVRPVARDSLDFHRSRLTIQLAPDSRSMQRILGRGVDVTGNHGGLLLAAWVARLDEPAPLAQDEPTRLGRSTQVADLDVIQDVVLEPEEDARVAADLAAPASALDIRGD